MDDKGIFEVELTDTYHYRFSYGGQSPYFHGLSQRKLIASRCRSCGHTWLPMRRVCSRCFGDTELLELAGEGEILTSLPLPSAPSQLAALGAPVASALVRVDGADTCIKTLVVSRGGDFKKGTRVIAQFAPEIRNIADFWFETV